MLILSNFYLIKNILPGWGHVNRRNQYYQILEEDDTFSIPHSKQQNAFTRDLATDSCSKILRKKPFTFIEYFVLKGQICAGDRSLAGRTCEGDSG